LQGYHIHITGRVQGIGFRPFIYKLAVKNGLKGTVSNTLDGVHIRVNCELCDVSHLVRQIKEQKPAQSIITHIHAEEIDPQEYDDFSIIDSDLNGAPDLLITPDFSICESCLRELKDPGNKRYEYPFITCTKCGPRFSIENGLPYDRHRTSMSTFKMCSSCATEYDDPDDVRFYSQTNSCPVCKISQWMVDSTGRKLDITDHKIIEFAARKIEDGNVGAVKGIGGFLLVCDPQNHEKVMELREKKRRPAKPFALLYPDVISVKRDFYITEREEEELIGTAAPIVLLAPKKESLAEALLHDLAPGLNKLGVMIPYAPVLYLIAKELNRPLLATSGNIKGAPIIHRNEEAVKSLSGFADFILLNNRDIKVPQDDSVVKFSDKYHQKIMIRRSRGYAPGYLQKGIKPSFEKRTLALGALLKSTFTVWNHGRCHVSQFLGDTMEFDAQISFERSLNHFRDLLQFVPEIILVDKHPAYYATQKGRELASFYKIPIMEVQHHEAHFWAVLGENELLHGDEKILGVIFDGSGMGNDGAIWGGEFFTYENREISRLSHVSCFPHILGDKMALEPKLSALSILHATHMNYGLEEDKFTPEELDFYDRVLENSSLCTSSVGRLFDAVASLLDLCHINTYEGEAAMYLERKAQEFINKNRSYQAYYPYKLTDEGTIALELPMSEIINDVLNNVNKGEIAAKFHNMLVAVIEEIANKACVNSIAFSGGVFQNGLLVDLIIEKLSSKFKLYFHKDLSPNDECISYGQLVSYYVNQKSNSKNQVTNLKNLV